METLKQKTAKTVKWNTIDRLASQVIYAAVGVVLANVLSKEDFGLAGAIMVFQAFAIIFVDSGFGAALLQKKEPTAADYSTVFWFNLLMGTGIYALLFFCAPLIADIFQGDRRLIPMSRVMFIAFVASGLGNVQTNRLMKQMNVSQIAISNLAGLTISGGLGIGLALGGFGAWALVWQAVALAVIKTAWLWVVSGWKPEFVFSRESFRSIRAVGIGVFTGAFLNTLFLNIYSFVVGAFYSLSKLGVYTQADKWSKMGTASLSQIFTASFVPLLSKVQDSSDDFARYARKITSTASLLVWPAMLGLAAMATPIFHTLFGNKWNAAIPLFAILCARGVFVVYNSLYSNFILSAGHAKALVRVEVVKDVATVVAILASVPFLTLEALVWGQLAASAVAWGYSLWQVVRLCPVDLRLLLRPQLPYLGSALTAALLIWVLAEFLPAVPAAAMLAAQVAIFATLYIFLLRKDPALLETWNYLRRRNSGAHSEA